MKVEPKKRSVPERIFAKQAGTKVQYEPRDKVAYYKTSYLPDFVYEANDAYEGPIVVEVKEWLEGTQMRRVREVASHYAKEGILFVVAVYWRVGLAPTEPLRQIQTWPKQGRMERFRLCRWLHDNNIHFICYDEQSDVEKLCRELAAKYYAD